MADSLAALVLGAGAGKRLAPLTRLRPKVLCPVGGVPLVDRALSQVAAVVGAGATAVNANPAHLGGLLAEHLDGRCHLSVEVGAALGTAGAVAHLRPWLDGRAVLVVNGDTWHDADLGVLLEGWDGATVRVLVAGTIPTMDDRPRVVGSVLPPAEVARLPEEPSGLWEVSWRHRLAEGRLEVLAADVAFVACDRPVDYLAANMARSGGTSVVGEGAEVAGRLVRSVVWPGATVAAGEILVDAVRASAGVTVLVR
jgi:N-acetyl-alpha-D-muramate 1-phosphate uridylyltransferase